MMIISSKILHNFIHDEIYIVKIAAIRYTKIENFVMLLGWFIEKVAQVDLLIINLKS